jgi:hypothetical protein
MAALTLLTTRDVLAPASRIRHRRDQATLTALRRAGISGELIERLFRPFLAGVFLESAPAGMSAATTGPPGPSRARWPPGRAPPGRSSPLLDGYRVGR